MKQTYLITAINPDNNEVISVWANASSITLAYDVSMKLLREEYRIEGYLKTILSITLR